MRLEREGSQSNRRNRLVAVVPPPTLPAASDLELERLFSEAYARLHGRVLDHAERFLDRDDARDAVQEVMADLWIRWPRLTPEQRSDEYVFGAVHNNVIDLLKGKGIGAQVSLEDANEELDRKAARAMETISRGDTAADVLDLALAVMPPRRREVLLLVKEHAFTYTEAAEALGLSIGTINSHMRLANKDLKTAFTRAGFRIENFQPAQLLAPKGDATND